MRTWGLHDGDEGDVGEEAVHVLEHEAAHDGEGERDVRGGPDVLKQLLLVL